MSEFSDLIIGPNDTITVEDWNDLVNNYHQLFLQRNNGLIINGLTVGRNSDQVTYQDTPQTTVGVSETNSDLRLQSPKRIMLHTNNKQEPNFAGKENNEMVGIFGDLVVHEAQSQGGRIYLGDYNHHIRCDFTKGITLSTYPDLDVMTIREGNGHVGIGTGDPDGKLNIIHDFHDATGKTLVLGPTTPNQSNLRLGYHQDYSWIQSHGNKPLSINSLGNKVGIGTTSPNSWLTIQGNAATLGLCSGQSGGVTYIELRRNGGPTSNRTGWIGYGSGGNKNLYIRNEDSGGHLTLSTNGGMVGIGTANPQGMLHIAAGGEPWSGWDSGHNWKKSIVVEKDHLIFFNGQFGIGHKHMADGMNSNNEPKFVITSGAKEQFFINEWGETAIRGGLRVGGNIDVHNGKSVVFHGGGWVTTSDKRLKNGINDMPFSMEAFMQLRPVNFKFNGKDAYTSTDDEVGLIAQEVQNLFPSLVQPFSGAGERKPEEGNKYLSIKTSSLIYYAIAAIKELNQEIEALKLQIKEPAT